MGGIDDLIKAPLSLMGAAFAPWQMLGGPQSLQADVLQSMTENPVNPFSLGSIGKLPAALGGMANAAGGNLAGGFQSTRLPNGQENPNAAKAMLMKQFMSRLGGR